MKLKQSKNLNFLCNWTLQMSESRASSVIQEWGYAGQALPQTLNPTTSNHAGSTNQLAQIDMMSYNQSQELVRMGVDDRVAEQMGLSYLPYTSCISNTSTAGSTNQHQSHANTQQVCVWEMNYWFVCNNIIPEHRSYPSSPEAKKTVMVISLILHIYTYLWFWPPGLCFFPPANSAGPGKQEEHQQGQCRVSPEAREEQHRCEKEPGQGPQEDPADPAEGPAAAGGKPEAADADRAADTGAGHSQAHPVTAAPAWSWGGGSAGVWYLEFYAHLQPVLTIQRFCEKVTYRRSRLENKAFWGHTVC